MSFKESWNNVEKRTFAFTAGAKDLRTPTQLLADMRRSIDDCIEAVADGNQKAHNLDGYSACEERLAALLTDLMQLAYRSDWDIPGAMAKRNTQIRNAWKAKQEPSASKSKLLKSGARKRVKNENVNQEDY